MSITRNIKVFYRVFPTDQIHWNFVKINKDQKTVYIRRLQDFSYRSNNNLSNYWHFDSDGVFIHEQQENIYEKVMEGTLEKVLEGYNLVILAYGQTGTGKSFTTAGLNYTEDEFGIAPRLIAQLLKLKTTQPRNIKMCLKISCVETLNSGAMDLLTDPPTYLETHKCRKVTKIKITSEFEALKILYLAEGRKEFLTNTYYSNTNANVVTFYVTTKNMDFTNPKQISSRIHIVDLAGTDTAGNISSYFKHPKQIGKANIAKSDLEQLVLCLYANLPEDIRLKKRLNALLYYLGSDLSNENVLRFLGHVRLLNRDIALTLSMFKFGQLIKGLKAKHKETLFEINDEIKLQYLEKRIAELEKEKYLNSSVLNQNLTQNLDGERLQHITRTVTDYLNNKINEITVLNVADAMTCFATFKKICNNCETERNKLLEELKSSQPEPVVQRKGSKMSKTSGASSSHVGGSKNSRKSKDSMSTILKRNKSTSSAIKTKTSEVSSAFRDPIGSVKHKKILKRSSITSRNKKSSTTSVTNKKEFVQSDENLPVPDILPEQTDIWNAYVTDAKSTYKSIIEQYKENEKNIKDVYFKYMLEIKNLHYRKECVDKRKNELLEAQVYRKFNCSEEYDENGTFVPGNAEKVCYENLRQSEDDLVKQQEKVLTAQAELKIHLCKRQEIVKRMSTEFDNYSKEKFVVPNADSSIVENSLKNETVEIDLDEDEHKGEQNELQEIPKEPHRVERIKVLQKIMAQEIEKRKQLTFAKKNIWKRY